MAPKQSPPFLIVAMMLVVALWAIMLPLAGTAGAQQAPDGAIRSKMDLPCC